GRFVEGLFEGRHTAPLGIDGLGQLAGGFAAAVGRQAVPVERVVPDLCSVIEHAAGRLLDDVFKRCGFQFGAGDEVVQVGDVRLMMLAVVELQGFCGDGGGQRIECVRKGRKLKSHVLSPSKKLVDREKTTKHPYYVWARVIFVWV